MFLWMYKWAENKDLSNLFYKTEKESPTKMRKIRSEDLIKMREVIEEI